MAELLSSITILSIALFVVGVGLIVAEFFIPGFGVCGVLGIIFLVADVFVTAKSVEQGLILAAFIFIILIIAFIIFSVLASHGKLPTKLVLRQATDSESGFSSAKDMSNLVGATGVTITPLRPAGNADFNGVRLDVVSQGDYIDGNVPVEVVEASGNRIIVRKKTESEVK